MRALFALALFFGATAPAWAEPTTLAALSDPVLAGLIQQSLAARPELAAAQASVRANQERVPQVRAWPDPMLQIGIQNDGFTSIEIGRMDTSYVSVMASQTFPWPGKLALQGELAALGVDDAKNGVIRQRLSTEAEVRRAYLDLALSRDRLAVLEQLGAVWQSALAMTRIVYQSGSGSQSDVLRAELELQRIEQRRLALRAEAQSSEQTLNRLRGHSLSEPIEGVRHLEELPRLETLQKQFSAENALARSPELASARLGLARAGKAESLAERGSYPDLTLGAGVMFRGQLPPMWQVTVAGPVPVFSARKQSRAAAESRAWGSVAQARVDELTQLIRLRSKERETAFNALVGSVAIYRQGLLIQSKATAESTLIQYRVGKVAFASVLEANAGYLADRESELMAIASAHRILIAEGELSLAPASAPGGDGSGAGMSGAGQ
jgi:cobalt-zinc-cadmium efflux system outer membrane protein